MRIPLSTYRIQLRPGFGFRETGEILGYLARLGITDVYASPLFKAQPGSLHGYDVADPNHLNAELGTADEWRALSENRRALDMGWVQDIVPNHMAFSGHTPLIADVFENGPRSAFYSFFDIDWNHPLLNGKVRAPFLGDSAEACLGRGELVLTYDPEGLAIAYFDNRFSLALESYAQVFEPLPELSGAELAAPEVEIWRRGIQQLIQVAAAEPSEARAIRIADAKQALWELHHRSPRVRTWVEQQVATFNAPEGRARLQRLLHAQFFELCFWQAAASEINYRRFFSINGLIGVRQEDVRVYAYTHRLIKRMIEEGGFTGLRIDHIDGLADPAAYLAQLRRTCPDTYIVVEKILALDEHLEPTWPVQGTTGYEFAAHLNALFTLPDHSAELTRFYQETTGQRAVFEELGHHSKAEILDRQFAGDLDNLVRKFLSLMSAPGEAAPDGELLRSGIARLLIHLPVYRTYLVAGEIRQADRKVLEKALEATRREHPELDATLNRLEGILLQREAWEDESGRRAAVSAFEQLAAALAAKGIEDTALYRYNRLAALNEVGGAPELFDGSRARFDAFAAHRPPHTLNALSTHDTKRSADVRARSLMIAEIPDEWRAHVVRWRSLNAAHTAIRDGAPVPDPEMEYLLYQTLIGTFPATSADLKAYAGRMVAYMIKAAREAKQYTRWSAPEATYEAGLQHFVETILTPAADNHFLAELTHFARKVAHHGRYTALSQCIIQLTAPGIPDLYQGSELFDDSLVDPDNRRPVDFARRQRMLDELITAHDLDPDALAARLNAQPGDRIKLYATYIGLHVRRQFPALFLEGRYLPLRVTGRFHRHVVAFARHLDGVWSLTVVPRFLRGLIDAQQSPVGPAVWADTRLEVPGDAPALWHNRFTAHRLPGPGPLALGDLLASFPVGLLTGEARP